SNVSGTYCSRWVKWLLLRLYSSVTCMVLEDLLMKIKNELPLKLNIQFFAEPETDPPGDSGGEKPDNETLTLTAEELQKRIESESDKKLDKVLQKEREKRDAE